jgi:glucose-1-phosphate cytidylyltransferase
MSEDFPVAILCGGRGTRLQEHTGAIPKALVEIGGRPILWHVVRLYAAQGMRRFLLLTGYLGDQIERFVADAEWPEPVEIECVDTGPDTPTGGRLAHVSERLTGGTFAVTYADGVADIDLAALGAYHRSHGGLGTVTVVRPRSQFGVAHLDGDGRVLAFEEKPRLDQWVNGGFFCFEPAVLAYLELDSVLEDAPLRRLAADGQLHAFRHTGFWDCMDTYKDATALNDLWNSGEAPWRVWEGASAALPAEAAREPGDQGTT